MERELNLDSVDLGTCFDYVVQELWNWGKPLNLHELWSFYLYIIVFYLHICIYKYLFLFVYAYIIV